MSDRTFTVSRERNQALNYSSLRSMHTFNIALIFFFMLLISSFYVGLSRMCILQHNLQVKIELFIWIVTQQHKADLFKTANSSSSLYLLCLNSFTASTVATFT